MITEGEKRYMEHAIELAEYIDQQKFTQDQQQFISLISARSGQDSRHERETQTASSQLRTLPISADRHRLKQKK